MHIRLKTRQSAGEMSDAEPNDLPPMTAGAPKLARAISRLAEHGDDTTVHQPLTDVLESRAVEAAVSASSADSKSPKPEEIVPPLDATSSLDDLLSGQQFCDDWEKQACLM